MTRPQQPSHKTPPHVASQVPPEDGFSSKQDVSQYHGDREELPPIVADELETSAAQAKSASSFKTETEQLKRAKSN